MRRDLFREGRVVSYCRWSSMNWRCDLYCYEDVDGGYTIHVAGNRVDGDIPVEPKWNLLDGGEKGRAQWLAEHGEVMRFLTTARRTSINLPHAGDTFREPTLE